MTRQHSVVRGKALIGVAIGAVALSGCAGNGSQSGGSESIHIAMIAPLSGSYSTIGSGNVAGAKAAVKVINKQGGIDGKKIVLDVKNDETNPSKSRDLMKEIADDDKYVAVIGSGFGSSALGAEPLANKTQIPYISMSGSGKQVDPVQPYVWQIPPTSAVVAKAIAAKLKKEGLTKIAVLRDNGGFATEGAAEVKKVADEFGLQVTADVSFSLDSTDFTSQLTKIKGSKADAVWLWNVTPQAVTVTKQFKKLGLPQQLVLTHGNPTPQFLKPACPQVNGAIIASTFAQVADPRVSSTTLPKDNPSKKLAEKVNKLLGKEANQFSYDGYTGVLFLAEAMKDEDGSREGIVKAFQDAKYVGPEGVYTFSKTNHAGIGPDSVVVGEVKSCKLSSMPG